MAPPIDETPLSQRAADLLPGDDRGLKANSPILLMGVATGPAQQILSSSQIEDNGFATELGVTRSMGQRRSSTEPRARAPIYKGALIVSQPNGAQIELDPGANIAFGFRFSSLPRRDKTSSPPSMRKMSNGRSRT